jgi:hypothetical protein
MMSTVELIEDLRQSRHVGEASHAGIHTGEVETIDGKAGRARGGDRVADWRARWTVRSARVTDRA